VKPDLLAQLQTALAGRYTVERELGRGGMATVFLARDTAGAPVAVKLLNPELGSTLGAERFRREIRVAARLQHPNILGVLDSGVAQVPSGGGTVDFLWFAMPFVEGHNVWERFEKEGTLPWSEVVRIGVLVAGALDYANRQGVVHRDIKPDNILLEGDRVLVADFGVARAVSEVAEKLTATGMVVGTPTYMSPEQASGEREIDGRTDIFALGCVLYELVAGEAPFHGPTPQATLMRRFTGPPRKLRPVIDVPEAVEAALMRALARDPAERFATAAEFAEALSGRASPAAQPVAASKPAGRKPAAANPVSRQAAAPQPASPASAGAGAGAAKKGCAGLVLLAVGLGIAGGLLLG
jgi:serine/threonine protein kinase